MPYLSASVEPWGILCCKQHESGMSPDDFLRLSHKQFPVVIQQPVESLQDVGGGQVQLIQDHPVAFPHGIKQDTWIQRQHLLCNPENLRVSTMNLLGNSLVLQTVKDNFSYFSLLVEELKTRDKASLCLPLVKVWFYISSRSHQVLQLT